MTKGACQARETHGPEGGEGWPGEGLSPGGKRNGEAGAGAAGAYRVVRGGDFSRPAAATRSAYRYGGHPAGRGYNLGVRLVREP